MGVCSLICIDLLTFNDTLLNSVATTPKSTLPKRFIVRRFWVSSADQSPTIRSARCGSISAGRGEHVWLPRCLAIWLNGESMPPGGRTLSKAIRVHRLSSGAPPTQLAEPMSFLVFGRRLHPPASMCWTTRRRSDTFLRSRRPSSLDLCLSNTFRRRDLLVGDAVPLNTSPGYRGSTPPSWDGGFGSVMSDDCSG